MAPTTVPHPLVRSTTPTPKPRAETRRPATSSPCTCASFPIRCAAPLPRKLVAKIEGNGWRLGTGFLGTPYLLAVLVDTGHATSPIACCSTREYPSWGYLVGHGATTMWERWNGDQMRGDPSMNSYNHYAYGAVADWIYSYARGHRRHGRRRRLHTIYLHPNFDARLGSLDFSYASRYGQIHSSWSMKGSTAVWNLRIPPNTTAELPLTSSQQTAFSLDGAPISGSKRIHATGETDGHTTYLLPAGTYAFSVAIAAPANSAAGQ